MAQEISPSRLAKLRGFYSKVPIYIWGFSGALIISIGCLGAAVLFQTEAGQPYSILHFFISELGGIGLSLGAAWFNWGLIIGGVPMALFMVGLALEIRSKWGIPLGLGGLYAAVNCSLVGVFPWNVNLPGHTITAMGFFYSGMVIVFLYSVFFLADRRHIYPKYTGIVGVFVALVFAGFLFLPLGAGDGMDSGVWRESLNWMALLEWMVLFGILAWVILLSVLEIARRRKIRHP